MNGTEQLRDIRGLDPISWWVLGIEIWIIIGIICILAVIILMTLYFRRSKKPKTIPWQQLALDEWKSLSPQSNCLHAQIEQLALLLKRAAMQRHGRETCASLTGTRWLAWLAQHDPNQFDWVRQGRILIELPYMPPDVQVEIKKIEMIYQAVGEWIKERPQS